MLKVKLVHSLLSFSIAIYWAYDLVFFVVFFSALISNRLYSKAMFYEFLERNAEVVARDLLGSHLERTFKDGTKALVKIVETEAYDQNDVASHSFNGMTPRNEVMFAQPGYLYVYFTYGMHYCCNVVVGQEGHGAAVLIRAVEPIEGEDEMMARRNGRTGIDVANGPAKLCQALNIDKDLNKHRLTESPLRLILKTPLSKNDIVTTTRIGISKGQEIPWRFYIKDNKYVSRR